MNSFDDTVVATLDSARGGRAAAMHVHGPRGAGKTWCLDEIARRASRCEMTVARARGNDEERELPFAALSTLLAPFRDRLADNEWTPLRAVVAFDPYPADAFAVKLTTFRFLCAMAAERPLCLLLDDIDLLDAASREVLVFAMRRVDADAIACFTTGLQEQAPTSTMPTVSTIIVRLDPMSVAAIERLLVELGVAANAAARCAEVADGNPGIAVAMATGLTHAQRAGTAPMSLLPRPSGGLVDELQQRLRAHGDAVCAALVVAAAEHGGDTAAARGALVALGEDAAGFDAAEALGLIDIVGARFTFTDPWTRVVAYHLVAPASRRAAHRALAAWFDAPEQAADRAWHLAAGSDGPSGAIADALQSVAADSARRGGLASAALTAERAAEFSTTAAARQRHLLAALEWWIGAASVDGVRRIMRTLDPLDLNAATARAEASEFLDGNRVEVIWDEMTDISMAAPIADAPAPGSHAVRHWARRRARRLAIEDASHRGDHRAVMRILDADGGRDRYDVSAFLALTSSMRHAGRLRDAREMCITASAILEGSAAFPAWTVRLLTIDLDVLQGRGDDAIVSLEASRIGLPTSLHEFAAALSGRARLQRDPSRSPADEPAAFTPLGSGALFEIRERIRDGVLGADPCPLTRAIELAEQHSLPVEAAEARVWLAALQPAALRGATVSLCRATLQRCGIRAWDQRLDRSVLDVAPVVAPRKVDPVLDALSHAEFRVADAAARGLTNREIASTLFISVKTVDFHLQQMYRKLGIRSRTELAVRMTNFEQTAKGDRR